MLGTLSRGDYGTHTVDPISHHHDCEWIEINGDEVSTLCGNGSVLCGPQCW